jgi:4-alpha-glucanotransferase
MKTNNLMTNREAGILLHITSLNGKYGIGTMGDEAYRFVDYLNNAGQKYWQILPLNPVGYAESPYQCFSAFAGNFHVIDLDKLVKEGLITSQELESNVTKTNSSTIDFETVIRQKSILLRIANSRFDFNSNEYNQFCQENNWLDNYSLFMAMKVKNSGSSWLDWSAEEKNLSAENREIFSKQFAEEIKFQKFLQFTFFKQWHELKDYANENEIKIIGDMPIFVSVDSADVWAEKENYQLEADGTPSCVAGVPPDYFSEEGQLWGNPHYNWDKMEQDKFVWWEKRFQAALEIYDIVRIDHFIGFVRYYAIPYGAKDGKVGEMHQAKGFELFEEVFKRIDSSKIIAEDLGLLTQEVIDLRDKYELPGMKILQFAFDVNDENSNGYTSWPENMIAYTGTHDNNTTIGWVKEASENEKKNVVNAFSLDQEIMNDLDNMENRKILMQGFIDGLYSTNCKLAILPIQDVLLQDGEYRINVPGTVGNNWKYILTNDEYQKTSEWINKLVVKANRKLIE